MIKKTLLILSLFIFTFANNFDLVRYSYIGDINKVKEYLKQSKTIPNQALLNAGYKNHTDIVKLLIENGANINTTSKSGRNILYYAIQNNNLELLKYLVKHGGKFMPINNGNDLLFEAVESGYINIVKYLLDFFHDLNNYYIIKGEFNRVAKTTLLITAIQNDHLDIAKLLIKNGANINIANNKDETPILTALRNKHYDMARYLIKKGANLKAQDIAGNNSLTYAITLKQEDVALKALEYIDITQWVDSSIFEGKTELYEYYIYKTKNEYKFANYLHLASRYGQTNIIKKLLQKGLDINTILKDKNTPMDNLQIAIYYSDIKTVKYLINNGANPYKIYNSSLPWGSYNTLISYSMITPNTTKNRQEIIKYLLSLPKSSWYKQNEDMGKIKNFLNKKINIYTNNNQRLKDGIKTNNYSDVIHSTKYNDKLITSVKQMLKLKHNINNEPTLLLDYFEIMENHINQNDIKKLLKLGATLGYSKQTLEQIYLLYSNFAVKYILKDKLFKDQILKLHKNYDITDIAIKIYQDQRISNSRIELMFELIYKYDIKFDFHKFKKVVRSDDNYINNLIKIYYRK